MSDNVHPSTRGVHSSFQSDSTSDSANMDAEASIPRKSSLPMPASSFGCSQCPKSFNRRENLSRHMKTRRHERWDKKEPKPESRRGSVKRRKTSEDPESHDNFENFNWTPTSRSGSAHLSPLQSGPSFPTETPTANYSTSFQESTGINVPFLEAAPRSFGADQQLNINNNVPQAMPVPGFVHQETHSFTQQYRDPYHDTILDHQFPTNSLGILGYSYQIPFSHTSYLQPENNPMGNAWVPNDLYATMVEPGNEWENTGKLFNQNIPISDSIQHHFSNIKLEGSGSNSTMPASEPHFEYHQPKNEMLESGSTRSASIAGVPSPPNLPWGEDKWPSSWNPSMDPTAVLEVDPIDLPFDHPLFQNHNPRYDISESTYYKMREFLISPVHEVPNRKPHFTMPPLYVVNIFIGLYFKHFSHQAPVLHHPTVDTNQLSPPLLSAMMIVGSTYSHVKNGRRLAIVLIEVIGWHLLAAIHLDMSLIRNPMTIFTEALLIHMGLWCGNKRAFGVSESFKGHAVSHMRRLYESEKSNALNRYSSEDQTLKDPQVQWKRWINEESLNRLYWVVFATDRQFSALWNQSSAMTIGELVDVSCPCDEVFWCAPSASDWNFALGSAKLPQSLSFAAAIGPFLFPLPPSSSIPPWHLPLPNLNSYTAFLVLLEIQRQIFDASQEFLVACKFINSQIPSEIYESPPGHYPASSLSQALKSRVSARRKELAYPDTLNRFFKTYLRPHLTIPTPHLMFFTILVFQTGIGHALERLRLWAQEDPELAIDVAVRAAAAIMESNKDLDVDVTGREKGSEAPKETKSGMIDTGVYGASLLMMTHVILWAFAQVADKKQKDSLMKRLRGHKNTADDAFLEILGRELMDEEDSEGSTGKGKNVGPGRPKVKAVSRSLFKSAADTLMRFGTWGVALDMAMLLRFRAEG
ncbi:C2H2 type zinc finger domain protein [Botrytis cinerea]